MLSFKQIIDHVRLLLHSDVVNSYIFFKILAIVLSKHILNIQCYDLKPCVAVSFH